MKLAYLCGMKNRKELLVGGKALMSLGSTRHSIDTDYLVCVEGQNLFTHDNTNNVDYINAAGGHDFCAQVWAMESNNIGPLASPQALLELKAFAFVQHCHNGVWQKADDCEFDIKFLVRTCGVSEIKIAKSFISAGELAEVKKVINSVKK